MKVIPIYSTVPRSFSVRNNSSTQTASSANPVLLVIKCWWLVMGNRQCVIGNQSKILMDCDEKLLTPEGEAPKIEQARQIWCVEMLMKGMNLEDLSILSGWNVRQLQPLARRAREKAALEEAIRLDRKV